MQNSPAMTLSQIGPYTHTTTNKTNPQKLFFVPSGANVTQYRKDRKTKYTKNVKFSNNTNTHALVMLESGQVCKMNTKNIKKIK
jgi:hypothetical protein